jgi:hypothetical protein
VCLDVCLFEREHCIYVGEFKVYKDEKAVLRVNRLIQPGLSPGPRGGQEWFLSF